MAVPSTVNDGSFAAAVQQGAPKWNYPFFDRGDSTSFECIITYWQDQSTYSQTPVGTTKTITVPGKGNYTCYAVFESNALDKGNGILEFSITYANLPITRLEGGAMIWSMQADMATYIYGTFFSNVIEYYFYSISKTWTVQWQFEYFTYLPSPILSPRVITGNVGGIGLYIYIGTQSTPSSPNSIISSTSVLNTNAGQRVAIQDSIVDIYKGNIYYRKTPFLLLALNSLNI